MTNLFTASHLYKVFKDLQLNYYILMDKDKQRTEHNQYHFHSEYLFDAVEPWRYCLHLPRHAKDTVYLGVNEVVNVYGSQHNILFFEYDHSDPTELIKSIAEMPSTLYIVEDSIYEEACMIDQKYKALLGCIKISELSSHTLKRHWNEIADYVESKVSKPKVSYIPRILSYKKMKALPLIYWTNQTNETNGIKGYMNENNYSLKSRIDASLKQVSQFTLIIKGIRINKYGSKKLENAISAEMKNNKIPLIMILPGRSQRKTLFLNAVGKSQFVFGDEEKKLIEVLGLHKAIAQQGVYLEGETLDNKIFQKLHLLETHFDYLRPNGQFIYNECKSIGKELVQSLPKDFYENIDKFSMITLFSDFNIGISIVPNYSDPLNYMVPISYRPLTPLDFSITYGAHRRYVYGIGKYGEIRILILECLDPTDDIYIASKTAWEKFEQSFNKIDYIHVQYVQVDSIHHLDQILNEDSDYDILIISAHGKYDASGSMTALVVCGDMWSPINKNVKFPPVVILSACLVSPRGSGAFSIIDQFVAKGVTAVLGPTIPINVYKNSVLLKRFFEYMIKYIESNSEEKSILQIWHEVVKSHAIYEILHSTMKLKSFADVKNEKGLNSYDEFYEIYEKTNIPFGNSYSCSLEILRGIARRRGYLNNLEEIIRDNKFVNESVFYIFSGYPEMVVIENHESTKKYEQFHKEVDMTC
ncbi:hypothetical protein [Paenibacillus kobensis]|uniref:hypothetical protein n=1 Tax=Paenibacillus kobensis TaxID=59841 RepID=UPI000FD7B9AE|nr:hypothetical protein [Paenibacillus kobensis]